MLLDDPHDVAPDSDRAAHRDWLADHDTAWAGGTCLSWAVEQQGTMVGCFLIKAANPPEMLATGVGYWMVAAARGQDIAELESACAVSRQVAARFTLDDTVPHDELGQVSPRFINMNIIAEYARHAGPADILREQIDGVTGDWIRHRNTHPADVAGTEVVGTLCLNQDRRS